VQDCYKLMCLVGPEVAQYEDSIQTLQSETAARKATTSQKEAELARQKLPIFQEIQVSNCCSRVAFGRCSTLFILLSVTQQAWRQWAPKGGELMPCQQI